MSAVSTVRSNLNALTQDAAGLHLSILGGFHPLPNGRGFPPGTGTLLLMGPREPGFWPAITASPEFQDGAPDPLDRWSQRVIGDWAERIGATALYPFSGPPFLPFIDWAQRTGRAWTSPVTLLVHADAGLFLSIRGALALPERIALPDPAPKPCDACQDSLCETACPVEALSPDGYDTDACHRHLDRLTGLTCLENGCAARRACPVSQSYSRLPVQSAFHMGAFHGNR